MKIFNIFIKKKKNDITLDLKGIFFSFLKIFCFEAFGLGLGGVASPAPGPSCISHTALKHLLTMTLGPGVGFCASAGFFMSAGLLGLGDMVEGLGLAGASPLPSDI